MSWGGTFIPISLLFLYNVKVDFTAALVRSRDLLMLVFIVSSNYCITFHIQSYFFIKFRNSLLPLASVRVAYPPLSSS
jgi:hypothetical protein